MEIVKLTRNGFQAKCAAPPPLNIWNDAMLNLGKNEISTVKAMAVSDRVNGSRDVYGFNLTEPDAVWRKFIRTLTGGRIHDAIGGLTPALA